MLHFMKVIFTVLLIVIFNNQVVHATNDCSSGACLNYQDDFGEVIIGTAKVQPDAVWANVNSTVYTADQQFAFTGVEGYYDQLTFKPSNKWIVEGVSYVHIVSPSPDKKMGIFFSPTYAKSYSAQLVANSKELSQRLRGIGVVDTTGLVGLDVKVYRRKVANTNCLSEKQSAISPACELLTNNSTTLIAPNDNVSFIIRPTITDPTRAQYARVNVEVLETDTKQQCVLPVARDKIPLDSMNRPLGEGMVEYISISGPSKLGSACYRIHNFFVAEMGKSFEFQTTVTNMPTTRSVAYLFYAEGHQSSTTGNVTVKLSSSDDLKIQVAIKGNGKVTNQTYGIDCPGKCVNTKNIALNTPVTLIAEPESGYTFDGWDGDCTGTTSSLLITLDKSKSCTARFIEKPVDLDKILVIQVIGNGKVTGKVNNKDIECTSISECRETFIMSDTSTTLTATPSGTESLQWAGACSNSGTATEAKVVLNEDKVCFAIFTATDTPINQNSPLGGISARSYVGSSPSQYLYAGIKLGKTTKVMIRGLGKSLLSQGVPEALDDAKLIVRKSDGATVDSNDNWQQHTSVNELLQYQHPSDPSDAALIVTLTEGLYTVELSSTTGRAGIGLVEIYEVK